MDRVADVAPWYRTDRQTLLFAAKQDLAEGPRARIDPTDATEDEDSCTRFGSCALTFWTGTALDGRRTADTCFDWTVYNVPAIGTVGRADLVGGDWAGQTLACGAYLALLCIEQ